MKNKKLEKLGEQLLTLVFPHKCFLCGRVLEGTGWLCHRCALPLAEAETLCPHCGKPRNECLCKEIKPVFNGVTVPLLYVGGVCHGIHRFKYSGRSYYAIFLGALMADCLLEKWTIPPFDGVTFVPMHPRKLRSRGYCQSELLAAELARLLGVPLFKGQILHTGNKRAQMTMKGVKARRENAARSFVASGEARLQGLTLLLVDDVLTTCSTVQQCASLLLEQGALAVHVAVVATTIKNTK